MRVIGTVGLPGSGKGEVAEVAKEMDVPVVRMGDVIRNETRERGLEPTDENFGKVAKSLREEEGMDVVARRCVGMIRDKDSEVVLVDGIRGLSEVEHFIDEFGNKFVLISIEVPFDLRFERITERGRSDDFETRGELRERDERELGFGMGEAMEKADVTVDNTGTLEEFRDEIRDIIEDVSENEVSNE